MNILALDTSTQVLAVAFIVEEKLVSEATSSEYFQHSKQIVSLVDQVLKEGNSSFDQVDLIAVGVGPGSFTGLRVGHAFVKGVCAASPIPVYPVSSLELIAYNIKKEHEKIAVILDARRGKFYFASFKRQGDGLVCLEEDCLLSLPDVQKRLLTEEKMAITGDALKRNREQLFSGIGENHPIYEEKDWYGYPANFQALLRSKKGLKGVSSSKLVPQYFRLTEAEEKLIENKGS